MPIYEAYLITNYRTGAMRLRKSHPLASDLGVRELVVHIRLTLEIPQPHTPTVEAILTVPSVSLFEVVLEDIML